MSEVKDEVVSEEQPKTEQKPKNTKPKTEQSLNAQALVDEKNTFKELSALPKRTILIPDDPSNPGDKVVPIGLNGVFYSVPRGIAVEVPVPIAEIWEDSYKRTREVNQRIDESVTKEVKVM